MPSTSPMVSPSGATRSGAFEHHVESIAVEVGGTQRVSHVRFQHGKVVGPRAAGRAAILFARPAAAELRRVEQVLPIVPLGVLGASVPTVDRAVADRPLLL